MVTSVRGLNERFGGIDPRSLLVALDFDGTLSEITEEPGRARVLPRSENALRRLATRIGRSVIISGRAGTALAELLQVPGLTLLGDYGLDRPDPAEAAALNAFAERLRPQLGGLPGVWLELKPGSATLHYRGAPGRAADVQRLGGGLAEELGLHWRSGRQVIEVMPARATKEAALGRVIAAMAPGAVVYAGDDTGDRGCFELVSGLSVPHLAVGVASAEAPATTFEACDIVVDGPRELAGLLHRLADWAEPVPGR